MIGEQKTSQLKGPFKAKENLINLMDETFSAPNSVIQLGIQADPGTQFYINGELYEIGNTGLYEQMGTEIISLSFDKDMDEKTFVEYMMIDY